MEEQRMKILYVNTTITHYNHPLLNKIATKGCQLTMLIPQTNHNTVGVGVKENEKEDRLYNLITTPCKKSWYGKDYLPKLKQVIQTVCPDVLLIGWPYMLQLFFCP